MSVIPSSLPVSSRRLWQGIAATLSVGTLVMLLVYFGLALYYRGLPFLGFTMTYTGTVNAGLATDPLISHWRGLDSGLLRTDIVKAFNKQPTSDPDMPWLSTPHRVLSLLNGMKVNDIVTVDVERNTQFMPLDPNICTPTNVTTADCSVTYRLTRFVESDFLAYFVLPYASGLILAVLGWAVMYLRGDRIEGVLCGAVILGSAVFAAGMFDAGFTFTLVPVWLVVAALTSGFSVSMGLLVPLPVRALMRYPWLVAMPIVVSAVAGLLLVGYYFAPTGPRDNNAIAIATGMTALGVIGLLVLQWFSQRPRAITPQTHDQNFILMAGTSLLLLPIGLWMLLRILQSLAGQVPSFSVEVLMPLLLFPNAAIAYTALQLRRFNVDRMMSTGATYLIMLGALVFSIFMLALGSTFIIRDALNISNPFMIGIIIFAMVLFFTPFRNRIQERIDTVYFRARRNYQQRVEEFGQKLVTLPNYERSLETFKSALQDTMMPLSVMVFLSFEEGDDYNDAQKQTDIRFLANSRLITFLSKTEQSLNLQDGQPWPPELWSERARLTILKASIIAPLPGTGRLNGFVMVGPSRSGNPYKFEEVRFVNSLVSQFAIATERAQVIESLERRVNELDVLSQVGQAVNFTIEFNDLLELVSTQTARLIDARCFYIITYQEDIRQLQYAFFVENDERYGEKENMAWALDDGLLSEVIRTNRPIRVANYALEMKLRSAPMKLENGSLRAWMGVPLNTGRRVLGVLAVARLNNDEAYPDEQFKMLTDIASLAASSIDKAALFSESKARERQLTVLNDITRQLVAAETDVEKLLELITRNAVEILNAEAGSLLLTLEDGSGDFEFRVVIGGEQKLLGERVSSTHGIVGQVAASGVPYISNDVLHDPQHQEAADSPQFRTMSLLAVPLIAKKAVIGVLEVLNKKDRTPFLQKDKDLLTTFAGQAAVAIENARLLRMTDIQLAQRVSELETLERIDSELNRTLDLHAVAEITVRSAVKITKANAGALGIVNLGDRTLEIVAIFGYTADEYPEGAEGLSWPLDKGIIQRVLRTKNADLVSDVNIDPAYSGGITGSLSQITVPMLSGREVNAVLIIEKRDTPRFNLPDWAFVQRIAEHASIAIANAQLYSALTAANESKSEFMAFAAHELKNPLTPIRGNVSLLQSGMTGQLSDMQKGLLRVVHTNSIRMERIINDLRDAASIDARQFSLDTLAPVDMQRIIDESAEPFERVFEERKLLFINDIPANLSSPMGDKGRLIQVFTNLISNSAKYTDDPAESNREEMKIIRAVGTALPSYTAKDGRRFGTMVRISLIDEGFGMKPEDLARLGKESYFRSTNEEAKKKEGTGMGMKLTFGIVANHKGLVEVESEFGKGTAFHIYLPLADMTENAIEPAIKPGAD